MGESGVGKSSVSELLTRWYGLRQIQSYTTRPRRYPEERGHIFLDKSQFKTIDDIKQKYPNRVAETIFDGEFYFATVEQVDECDLYVIDPAGIACLKDLYGGKKGIKVIRIKCSKQDRIERMRARGDADMQIYSRLQNDKVMFANAGELADFSVINQKRDLCARAIMKYIAKEEGIKFE